MPRGQNGPEFLRSDLVGEIVASGLDRIGDLEDGGDGASVPSSSAQATARVYRRAAHEIRAHHAAAERTP